MIRPIQQVVQRLHRPSWTTWLSVAVGLLVSGLQAGELEVRVRAVSGDAPLRIDQTVLTNAVGERVTVSRLDFLLSDFRFVLGDGSERPSGTRAAFVGMARGRRTLFLRDFPAEQVRAVRFRIGLPPELDRIDVQALPSDDPLNPSVNGLHWGWLGGFVFLALEGNGRTSAGVDDGFSHHLAGSALAMPVELPLDRGAEGGVVWDLDVGRMLREVPAARLGSSSHSRAGDRLAIDLAAAAVRAFRAQTPRVASSPVPAAERAASPGSGGSIGAGVETVASLGAGTTRWRFRVPSGFPIPALPRDNPLTVEGVELGRRLFEEPALSVNGSRSCASCHDVASAFVDAGHRSSRGAEGVEGDRNAMPLANLAWQGPYFWDGRAKTLREQVLMPITNPVEMHETPTNVVRKLVQAGYETSFETAFGPGGVTVDRLARALEQFLLVQVSADSKFDRVGRGESEFTDLERRGFELFFTEHDPRRGQYGADCFHCHGGPLFTDSAFHNNGLDAEDRRTDAGRARVTGNEADRGRFRTPSLRNVARTAPYMHDGRFATLEETVAHYCTGVKRASNLDPNLAKHPEGGVGLDPADQQALVAFLKTLSDLR